MKNLNFATNWNADLIESQHSIWLNNPDSLDSDWRAFFEGFDLGQTTPIPEVSADIISSGSEDSRMQACFTGAIWAFRSLGHTQANIDPLAKEAPHNPRLSFDRLGFEKSDLGRIYDTGNYLGSRKMTVSDLLANLRRTYCGSIGVEYLHIQATNKRRWLQARMEPTFNQHDFTQEEKIRVLRKVREAELFEQFLHTHYVGQKRFSLEGGETLIACLDSIVQNCPELGVDEIVMGMAHRGRLNVLANILEKSYAFIFEEFSDNYYRGLIHGDGDVKYHLGFNNFTKTVSGHEVEVRLAANPSHLEAVDPVVQGKTRALQRLRGDLDRKKVVPVLVHGDAAIAGQGIVAEVFNFSQLKGYHTGGTIHVVVNNQIGFTTNPEDSRSGQYCTDIAKMIEVPIFHVNGNDPLAVSLVAQFALAYRQEFGEDVVIDINCFRRLGHNEADEPAFTQPVLYRTIAETPNASEVLVEEMVESGDITRASAEEMEKEYQDHLEDLFQKQKQKKRTEIPAERSKASSTYILPYSFKKLKTAVSKKFLKKVTDAVVSVPEGFQLNPKIRRQLDRKREVFEKGEGLDWGMGEQLAFGTLLLEGTPVRLSGQDSKRGTFSHRHAVYYDVETRERYVPLLDIEEGQAQFCVYNSSLSEAGILGFDFGYAQDYPEMLAIWEAQFGDFANGAQVIIDQFIASGESKWGQPSGIVMLLPHGYEGQGPEHSSARPERYLQLCAENNMQVCNLTTPAQLFHCLRRQMKQEHKRPLVIFTPKSLLRHKLAVSSLKEFTSGHFQEIVDDPSPPKSARKLILCSGKVYYDLLEKREQEAITDAAIVRVEQFYPLNEALLQNVCGQYSGARVTWCQEEPKNMGGWSFMAPMIGEALGHRPIYAGRAPAASPATGSLALHRLEQRDLLEVAFT